MQYGVDILTKIYALEIICLQLFRLAIDGLKYDVVKGKTGMAGATEWLLKHSQFILPVERTKQPAPGEKWPPVYSVATVKWF